MLWIDVEDLARYAIVGRRPSGIQRFVFEVCRALVDAGTEIGFVRHKRLDSGFCVTDWACVAALYEGLVEARDTEPVAVKPVRPLVRGRMKSLANRIPPELLTPLGHATRAQLAVFDGVGRAIRESLRAGSARGAASARREEGPEIDLLSIARPGDTLCIFGGVWDAGYGRMVARIKARGDLSCVVLLHDLISIVRPEFHVSGQREVFAAYLRDILSIADHVFTVSQHTARDLANWAARENIALSGPPSVLPVGAGLEAPGPGRLPESLQPGGYALFVSTLEPRKNHVQAFRIWQRLLESMPRDHVPDLVFAGRIGWMVGDLIQAIDNTNWLDGKLKLVHQPDDATMAALYRDCRFTLFLSHYEGWGLPVSESLAFGKAVIASDKTSVPEAGGDFCLYVDPSNTTGAYEVVRKAIQEPEIIRSYEAHIAAHYQPVPWSTTAEVIKRELVSLRSWRLTNINHTNPVVFGRATAGAPAWARWPAESA
jgi:glycosyltransferase involved in cell wall biosynthesis